MEKKDQPDLTPDQEREIEVYTAKEGGFDPGPGWDPLVESFVTILGPLSFLFTFRTKENQPPRERSSPVR